MNLCMLPPVVYRVQNLRFVGLFSLLLLSSMFTSLAWSKSSSNTPSVRYEVAFDPEKSSAAVAIVIEKSDWLSSARFRPPSNLLGEVQGNGKLETEGSYTKWTPPSKEARLEYQIDLKLPRKGGGYDALVTSDWGLLRGEDLFPSFLSKKRKGVVPQVEIHFTLPDNWPSVNTGWERKDGEVFFIPSSGRGLPRPPGWIIAGDLGTRHEVMAQTQISISAPKGHDFRQMESLAFLRMVWPQFDRAFYELPAKILITGAADPMWRGGLSSPTGLYLHSDRPLVSENGTSTLLHELIHVITGIRADNNADWIVEGIAEFYSVELIFRAGGYSEERREAIFAGLKDWGGEVKSLLRRSSYGPYTARSAVLFEAFDKEIQSCTAKTASPARLDAVVNELVNNKSVSLDDLQKAFTKVCGESSKVLQSPLISAE